MQSYRTFSALTLASLISLAYLPAATAEETPSLPSAAGTSASEETDRLIVTFTEDAPTEERASIIKQAEDGSELTDTSIVKEEVAANGRSTVVETGTMLTTEEQQQAIEKLEGDPRIASVEPDRLVKALASTAEPYYPNQWALNSSYLNAATAWGKYNGAGQTIGVVDTGFTLHPDFNDEAAYGYDFISSDYIAQDTDGRDTYPLDQGSQLPGVNWHGTFVAGIAGAKANGTGTTGIAPAARVTHARALGLAGDGYISDIADALIWSSGGTVAGVPANKYPADVVNLSLSYPSNQCSAVMQSAINSALSRNVPVVVAAGNVNANATYQEPANCYRAIVVGASTSSFTLAGYSNYGPALDVVAPGGSGDDPIFGALNTGFYKPGAATYGTMYGTSMAAPYVAGTIALMKQAYPEITVEQIRGILTTTGSRIAGYPSVNTAAAVQAAEKLNPASQFAITGAIGNYYWDNGGASTFGLPTGNSFTSVNGGIVQRFANNYSIYSSAAGTASVKFSGSIGSKYRALGYEHQLGYPVFAEAAVSGGAVQKFALADGRRNALYWSPATQRTHRVWEAGAIGARYTREGATSAHGFPIEDETAFGVNGARQVFENGNRQSRFYWAANTGTYPVNGRGAIFYAWESRGGVYTDGFPASDELALPDGGVVQYFRNASGRETGIWWSPTTGAHAVNSRGSLYYYWLRNGYISSYGYPTTDETLHADGSVTLSFSRGVTLKWTAATGVVRVR